ncbi:MAG: hypothetical protein J5496_05245 [Lachnospiraceae bacterium]|nr:hypothetical protein [Lachnospiraceae bacterium]
MNTMDIIEAVNALDESLLAEALADGQPAEKDAAESSAASAPAAEKGKEEKSGSRFPKRKLKRWGVAAACLLIAALAASCAARTTQTDDEAIRLIELNRRQSRPTRLYHLIEQTMQSLGYDLIGGQNCPEDYGGYYVSDDRETLCLCLVSPTEESTRRYLSLLTEDALAYVRIVPVRYSQSELQAMVREVFEAAAESKAEVYMGGPDDRINGLNFGGSEEGLAWVREYMRQHYPDVPLQTEICGPIVFT